eukprot:2556874-Prymnesium_polylepis.2
MRARVGLPRALCTRSLAYPASSAGHSPSPAARARPEASRLRSQPPQPNAGPPRGGPALAPRARCCRGCPAALAKGAWPPYRPALWAARSRDGRSVGTVSQAGGATL